MARVLTTLSMENVYTDRRPPLTPKVLLFALILLRGRSFPPIHVERKENGRYVVRDGRNRYAAHKLVGRKAIKAVFGIHEAPSQYKDIKLRDGVLKSPSGSY